MGLGAVSPFAGACAKAVAGDSGVNGRDGADWIAQVPGLDGADAALRGLLAGAREMEAPEGAILFQDGDACQGYVIVLEGSVRVQKIDPEGHEIVLYRVEDGQTCMLTTACLLGGGSYPAEGVAETPTRLVMLPAPLFERAMDESALFRRFVMRGIGRRIADLMMLIEEVAFGQMDERLARRLLELAGESASLAITHQRLATELGTAREVVSRLLKDFERRGWLHLARGRIEIRDRAALSVLGRRG